MTGRLISVLGPRSRLGRRLTVAAIGLLALGAVASALTPARGPERRAGQRTTGSARIVHTPVSRRHDPAVSAGELARARETADPFLAGYLSFLYGRATARSVDAVTTGLRLQLVRVRAVVVPPAIPAEDATRRVIRLLERAGRIAMRGTSEVVASVRLAPASEHGCVVTSAIGNFVRGRRRRRWLVVSLPAE